MTYRKNLKFLVHAGLLAYIIFWLVGANFPSPGIVLIWAGIGILAICESIDNIGREK